MHKLYDDDPRPIAKQIVRAITVAIAEGEFQPGQPILSRAALAEHFGASLATVNTAITELKAAGILVGKQGSGVFVHSHGTGLAQAQMDEPKPDLYAQLDELLAGQTRIDTMVNRIAEHLGINPEEQP